MLDALIDAHREALRAFLDEPRFGLLILRAPADIELLAARFLAQYGRSREPQVLACGVSVASAEPARFCEVAAQSVIEAAGAIAEAVAATGVPDPPRMPAALGDGGPDTAASPEALWIELIEASAREAYPYAAPLMIALRFEEGIDVPAAQALLGRLAALAASPLVKLVVIDDRARPRFCDVSITPERYASDTFTPTLGNARVVVERLLASASRRVLALRMQGQTAPVLLAAADACTTAARPVRAIHVQAHFRSRTVFSNAVAERVLAEVRRMLHDAGLLADAAGAMPEDLYDVRSMAHPEASLTALVERAAAPLLARGELLVVLIEPAPIADTAAWQRFAEALNGFAASRRVKYVLLDSAASPALPDVLRAPYRPIVLDFDLPQEAMVVSIEEDLKRPDLALPVRAQLTMMMTSHALARKDEERALALGVESVQAAEASGVVPLQVAAWSVLGRVLRAQGRFVPARNAHEQAMSLALDHGDPAALASTLSDMGDVFFHERSFPQAIECYRGSEKLFTSMGNVLGACRVLTWTGEALAALGDAPEAARQLEMALARYGELGERLFGDQIRQARAEIYERLARVLAAAGQGARAEDYRLLAREFGSTGHVPEVP